MTPEPPSTGQAPRGTGEKSGASLPRWVPWTLGAVLLVVLMVAVLLVRSQVTGTDREEVPYEGADGLLEQVERIGTDDEPPADQRVVSIEWNNTNTNSNITGEYENGDEFQATGPAEGPSDADRELFADRGVDVSFHTPTDSWWESLLPR